MIKKQGPILIVDDNRNILTTVRMLLEPIFDGIITIANPNSLPAKLREEHPAVVLLDMNFASGINSGDVYKRQVLVSTVGKGLARKIEREKALAMELHVGTGIHV